MAPSFNRIASCLALGVTVAAGASILPWTRTGAPNLAAAEVAEVPRGNRFWTLEPAPALASRPAVGRSVGATWLGAPLAAPRVSSEFGMRLHPLLAAWLPHQGVDFAAAEGTPVQSVSGGIVRFAGMRRFYGIDVDVDHPDGSTTRYAHLSALASAIRAGTRVRTGQTIGYVGRTGRATGPHLHFEFLIDGRSREPLAALRAARLAGRSR